MPVHPFQASVDALPSYLADALQINEVATDRIQALVEERRKAGKNGSGRPGAASKSLNRAVVVAAVGALEAFCEDLALTALPLVPMASKAKPWFAVKGSRGMVQTPNSESIAKMFWVYFRYDPRPDWNFLVTTAWSEVRPGGTQWRGTTANYSGTDAAAAIDAMVKVRHGFAHQDRASLPGTKPGIVAVTPSGKLSFQSHHAFNAMSVVAQAGLQLTHGLANFISGPDRSLRWKSCMTPLQELLVDTPVASEIRSQWTRHPF